MACTAPITTWRSSKAEPSPAATRKRLWRPISAGWKPYGGPASWSAWPRGYGRCRTTWPSVAASTTRSGWAACSTPRPCAVMPMTWSIVTCADA
ncbi:hypothetical protein G6F68_018997 [Rhizopus microsporus]|nr:hypothetical protein G6F68_018997 [Rhizopus microsporus]